MSVPVNNVHSISINAVPSGQPLPNNDVEAVLERQKIYAYITHQNGGNLRSRDYQEFIDKHEAAVRDEWDRLAEIVRERTGGGRLVSIWPQEGRVAYRMDADGIKRNLRIDSHEMNALRALYQEEKWNTAVWTECRPFERGCSAGRLALQKATPFLAELSHNINNPIEQARARPLIQMKEHLRECIEDLEDRYHASPDNDEKKDLRENIRRHRNVQNKLNSIDNFALHWAWSRRNAAMRGDIKQIGTQTAIANAFRNTRQWLHDRKQDRSFHFLGAATLTSAEEDYARDLVLLSLSDPTDVNNRERYDLALETMHATKSTQDRLEDLLLPLFLEHLHPTRDGKKNEVIDRIAQHPLFEAEEAIIFRQCCEALH